MWPLPGMHPLARKAGKTRYIRHVRRGEAADGGNEVPGAEFGAVFRRYMPQVGLLIVSRCRYPRVETNVPLQVEAICNVVEVAQDFRLCRIALGPFPTLEQLLRE